MILGKRRSFASGGALVLMVACLGWQLAPGTSTKPLRVSPEQAPGPRVVSYEAAASMPADTTAAETGAVPKPTIASEADLNRYYAALEERARERGSIDDELPRAVEAYKVARGIVGPSRASLRLSAFGDRLNRLRRQQQIAPTLVRLDSLAHRIGEEKNAVTRSQLSSEYNAASAHLPPVEQLEATDRLQALMLRP